jgi:hypothetical protein
VKNVIDRQVLKDMGFKKLSWSAGFDSEVLLYEHYDHKIMVSYEDPDSKEAEPYPEWFHAMTDLTTQEFILKMHKLIVSEIKACYEQGSKSL